jgi:acyl carrier protein
MTESDFKQALAEFSSMTADELAMSDDLEEVGVDSIAVYEFMMAIEDKIGPQHPDLTDNVKSVQALYDCVLEAAERASA